MVGKTLTNKTPAKNEIVELTFFACLYENQIEEFKEKLSTYADLEQPWLITHEIAPLTHQHSEGNHFHTYCYMSLQSYSNFRETILRKHFGLKGKGLKGEHGKMYGKEVVRDGNCICRYILKQKGTYLTNMSESQINKLMEEAPEVDKKAERERQWQAEIFQHITDNMTVEDIQSIKYTYGTRKIKELIVRKYIKDGTGRDCPRNSLDRYVRIWIMHFSDFDEDLKVELILNFNVCIN